MGGAYLLGLYWFTGHVLTSDLLNGNDLVHDCRVYQADGSFETVHGKHCVQNGLEKARTMAFITVALSETFRGLTVKSLDPIYCNVFDNKWLLGAIALSLSLSVLLLFVPGLSDVFGYVCNA